MIRLTSRLAATGAAVLVAACAQAAASTLQEAPSIDRADVERIVSTLASDEMMGREAFSEHALEAADFIASEFRDAGLEDFGGSEGYLQHFAAVAYSMGPARAVIDGRPLTPDRFQIRYGVPSIRWRTGDVPVYVVGPDVDAGLAIDIASSGQDALILVDEAHAEPFRTLSQLFRRPTQYVSGADMGTQVVALVNGTPESTYDITGTSDVLERPLVNVVGQIPGRRSDEYVVFSAHYDHLGTNVRMVNGDSIANGANDDASGVSAVIELAKYFHAQGTPERTLLFAAFTAEEAGGFGSTYFSNQLDPDQIVAMFNIEMIGKPAVDGPNTAWITGFDKSTFGEILQQAVEGTQYRFYPDPYPQLDLFYRSDNRTLAALGVPAHSISTTPIDVDRDYHQPTDEVRTLDLDHLTNTIEAIARGAETIVSGQATPTRITPLS